MFKRLKFMMILFSCYGVPNRRAYACGRFTGDLSCLARGHLIVEESNQV